MNTINSHGQQFGHRPPSLKSLPVDEEKHYEACVRIRGLDSKILIEFKIKK